MPTPTSRTGTLGLLCGLLLCSAATVWAHVPETKPDREIVRMQGYLSRPPASVTLVGEMVLNVLGADHPFFLTAWQPFSLRTEGEPSPFPARLALQGERSDLAKVGAARAEQRVTILGERHPGAPDLFLLAVDFCPP